MVTLLEELLNILVTAAVMVMITTLDYTSID